MLRKHERYEKLAGKNFLSSENFTFLHASAFLQCINEKTLDSEKCEKQFSDIQNIFHFTFAN